MKREANEWTRQSASVQCPCAITSKSRQSVAEEKKQVRKPDEKKRFEGYCLGDPRGERERNDRKPRGPVVCVCPRVSVWPASGSQYNNTLSSSAQRWAVGVLVSLLQEQSRCWSSLCAVGSTGTAMPGETFPLPSPAVRNGGRECCLESGDQHLLGF